MRFPFRRPYEPRLDSELRDHLERAAQRFRAGGADPAEALRRARLELGGLERIKDECRDVRRFAWLEDVRKDLAYAARSLRRSPGFLAVAVLSLSLGIGANTAIFSIAGAVLLKSLPVRDPARLYLVKDAAANKGEFFGRAGFDRIRTENSVFQSLCGFSAGLQTWNAEIDGQSEPVATLLATGDFYAVLGEGAIAGRVFSAEDDRAPSGNPVAVIGYGFWQRRFARSPAAIGKTLRLNGGLFTIAGVTPPEFFGATPGQNPDITIPQRSIAAAAPGRTAERNNLAMRVLGRLMPGMPQRRAEAGLQALYQRMLLEQAGERMTPEERNRTAARRLTLESAAHGVARLRELFSKPVLALMALVGLLLLAACCNIANLLTARNLSRRREFAVRAAIGAGRGRIVRQLMTESAVLAAAGGLGGLALAFAASRLLGTIAVDRMTLNLSPAPDAGVLCFAAALSALTAILCGVAPAVRATRLALHAALKSREGRMAGAPLGRLLIPVQVALSLILLIGAGLFVRTLQSIAQIDPGFHTENLLVFHVDPTLRGYHDASYFSVIERILTGLRSLPGVRGAAFSDHGLLGGGSADAPLILPGRQSPAEEPPDVIVNHVSPGFFETMGMTILRGRGDPTSDAPKATGLVVNDSLARRYFPTVSPVGQRAGIGSPTMIEITGVARDAKYDDLRTPDAPAVFITSMQSGPQRAKTFEVRSVGDPLALAGAVRRRIAEIDRDLMVYDLKTESQQAGETIAAERLTAQLAACFGSLALIMAAIGLYGVIAFNAARRTSEIGIRVALGAQRWSVMWLVLRSTLAMAALGIAAGLPAALLLARLASSLLFGVSAADPPSILAAVALLLFSAVLAAAFPARRAARLDPAVALRSE